MVSERRATPIFIPSVTQIPWIFSLYFLVLATVMTNGFFVCNIRTDIE